MTAEMKPSVGRIVHYVLPDGQCRAAIIVRVWDLRTVNLSVFGDGQNDAHMYKVLAPDLRGVDGELVVHRTSVSHDEAGVDPGGPPRGDSHAGTWHWPERT